jgi:hypothetical protein
MVVDESVKPELFRNVESSSEIRGEYVPFSDCLGYRTTQFPQSTFATHASVSLRRICLDATLAVIAGFARVGKNTYTHVPRRCVCQYSYRSKMTCERLSPMPERGFPDV